MAKEKAPQQSLIPLNVPINNLKDMLGMLFELFERPQEKLQVHSQYVGDCYNKLVDAQKTYLFQKDDAGVIVLRKGVQEELDVFSMTWRFDARISQLALGEKKILAFIPPF